jgi:hypothetical protein
MVRRYFGAVLGVAALLMACGDDGGGPGPGTDTATGGDTANTIPLPGGISYCDPGTATATKSGVTCVETNVQVEPVTPNASCFANDEIIEHTGLAYPWGGATIGGRTFTCNGCPNGLPILQGRFRVHGYLPDSDTVDYREPDPVTDLAWILFIDGNTFFTIEYDAQRQRTSWSRGRYFCSMKAENGAKHLYWQDLESSNSASVGQWTRTDTILSSGGGKNLLIKFFNSVNTSDASGIDFPFCKIGTTTDGQLCNDPFTSR